MSASGRRGSVEWVAPSTDATFDVIEAATEDVYFRVAEAMRLLGAQDWYHRLGLTRRR